MRTLFISDLHLDDARPETTEWFLAFAGGPAQSADAVYILGDLFEYWIGDDALSAAAKTVAGATSALAKSGVPVSFIHGNRDFLLGRDYAAAAALKLLPESITVDLYGYPTLLLHGDTLCTDDHAYQAFRSQSRDPAWQQAVLAMSVDERLALAQNARDVSMAHTGSAGMDIMDVNPDAVTKAFRDSGTHRMIHGHTHRPAVHSHDLGSGEEGQRIVLADWYDKGSYLEVTAAGFFSKDL
jgi:UDP-2,3-diacylglucosamine hydrolase